MFRIRLHRPTTLAALAIMAAACGPTEPEIGAELDADAALADYETLDEVMSSPELAAFATLGGSTPFGSAPAAIDAMAQLPAPTAADGGRAFAHELFRRIAATDRDRGPDAAPVISSNNRGKTFAYDVQAGEYQEDPERTGAPETGVRFVLYEPLSDGTPDVTQEVGYVDLIDEGDGSAEDIALRLLVVHTERTVLDYRTTLDHNENRGALTVRGFIQGENARLDFDIEAVGTEQNGQETIDLAFDMRIDARDFSIVGNVSGLEDDDDGEGEIDITVRHRDASLRVDAEGSNGELNGTFYLNGDIFATISGPEENPTFLGQSGEPLTQAEVFVLHRMADTFEDVFDFLEDLIDPVDEIVILGVIL